MRDAWDAGMTLVQEEVVTENGNRIEISLDIIHDERSDDGSERSGEGLGALLTLHDQESVEVIESELELSRRMAAIGRLTSNTLWSARFAGLLTTAGAPPAPSTNA